jgi:arsenate reductase
MAEGFQKSMSQRIEVYSAGTNPSERVHPIAIRVMKEAGIDISDHFPKHVDQYLGQSFDYVITVCGGAKESCPAFMGNVDHRIHIGFDDPAEAHGTEEYILSEFRRIRDEIKRDFKKFYEEKINQ